MEIEEHAHQHETGKPAQSDSADKRETGKPAQSALLTVRVPRVLVVTTSRRTRGGIASVVRALEQEPVWTKHRCRWIATQIDRGVLMKMWYLVSSYLSFFWWVGSYDIVHFHTVPGNSTRIHLPLLRRAKRSGLKCIVHLHIGEQLVEYVNNKQFRALLDEADRVLVLSRKALELVKKYYRLETPVEVVYNACRVVNPAINEHFTGLEHMVTPEISVHPKEPGYAEISGVNVHPKELDPPPVVSTKSDRRRMILVAGILDANKAYDTIIRAFSQVARRHTDWKLVFAGNGEVEKARALASDSGAGSQVEFRGWVSGDEKAALFRQSSVFCLASYKEGFPMAVLEAWAYGIPVVCTAAGGLADVVADGVNALVVEPGNSDDLARQLERMMTDEGLRSRIVAKASQLIREQFSPEAINAQLERIYKEL